MKRIVTIAGIVLLVAAIAVPAFSHGRGWGKAHNDMGYGHGGPGYCWQQGSGYENLTEEQRGQLDKLRQEFRDENAQLRDKIRAKSAEIKVLLNSSNPDPEKASALQKEISDLRTQMDQSRLNLQLEERKIAPELRLGKGYGRSYGAGMGYGQHMRGYDRGRCRN
ncbi:MAG: periplasmic heavy metal sensor [Deltaproteobacteria bacterium]|nr:periplasmic heavy metal sensor [Deltaproteobacteria bacterium]